MIGVPSGYLKVDGVLTPGGQTAQTETITDYLDMKNYEKVIFVVTGGSIGAVGSTAETVVRGIQAVSSTGSGAATLGSSANLVLGTTDLDAITDAASILITCGTSPRTGETVAINGITFTFSTLVANDAAIDSSRLISASSGSHYSVQLSSAINDATYGCTGLLATQSGTAVTVTANPPGEKAIDITISVTAPTSSGSARATILKSVGYFEALSANLSVTSSMRYVAIGITPASSCTFGVTAIRSGARYSPTQYVDDSAMASSTA